MGSLNNILDLLESDRKQQLDFFNDIITNKKMSEETIKDLMINIINPYNQKMLEIVDTLQKRKDELNEKDMNKFYETKLKEQENYNNAKLEEHRINMEYSIKPRNFANTVCDFADSFARGAEAISKFKDTCETQGVDYGNN